MLTKRGHTKSGVAEKGVCVVWETCLCGLCLVVGGHISHDGAGWVVGLSSFAPYVLVSITGSVCPVRERSLRFYR